MNSDWSIRWDVVRRLPDGKYDSACVYGDQIGFDTVEEATAIQTALQEAQAEVELNSVFVVSPLAVNRYAVIDGEDDMSPVGPPAKLVSGHN